MGLDINADRFLIDARQRGADFGDVLTLSRQDLNRSPPSSPSGAGNAPSG
jgi:hypothetical protein